MKNLILSSLIFISTLHLYSQTSIECEVYGNPSDFMEMAYTKFTVDGSLEKGEYNGCGTHPAFVVAVIGPNESIEDCDSWGTYYETDSVIYNPDNNFGNSNNNGGCRDRIERHFVFMQNDPVQLDSLNSMLKNKIPDAMHVLIYSWFNFNSDAIEYGFPELVTTFNELGWTEFNLDIGNVPFILYAEIGSPLLAEELYDEEIDSYITFEQSFDCDFLIYGDTVGTGDPVVIGDGDDPIGSGVGIYEEKDDLSFSVSNTIITISGENIERYSVQNIYTLDGREIAYDFERNANKIKLSPISFNSSYLILQLLGEDGNQIRKLVPFGLN